MLAVLLSYVLILPEETSLSKDTPDHDSSVYSSSRNFSSVATPFNARCLVDSIVVQLSNQLPSLCIPKRDLFWLCTTYEHSSIWGNTGSCNSTARMLELYNHVALRSPLTDCLVVADCKEESRVGREEDFGDLSSMTWLECWLDE